MGTFNHLAIAMTHLRPRNVDIAKATTLTTRGGFCLRNDVIFNKCAESDRYCAESERPTYIICFPLPGTRSTGSHSLRNCEVIEGVQW